MGFTKQEVIDVEKHIEEFKCKASIVLCEHNNDHVVGGIGIVCPKCNIRARYDNYADVPVEAKIARCPVCKNEKKIVTINLKVN